MIEPWDIYKTRYKMSDISLLLKHHCYENVTTNGLNTIFSFEVLNLSRTKTYSDFIPLPSTVNTYTLTHTLTHTQNFHLTKGYSIAQCG